MESAEVITMILDRPTLLFLAASLAGVACSSSSAEETDGDEGAIRACPAPETDDSIAPSTECREGRPVKSCLRADAGFERRESSVESLLADCRLRLGVVPTARSVCARLVGMTLPAMAERIVGAIKAETVDREAPLGVEAVTAAALSTLLDACRKPAEVDGLCQTLVTSYQAAGKSNAGGRLTNECRSLMPGLRPEARVALSQAPVPADGKVSTALLELPPLTVPAR